MSVFWFVLVAVLAVLALRQTVDLWTRARLRRYAVLLEPKAQQWLEELRLEVAEDRSVAEIHARLAREQWHVSRAEALADLEALVEHFERTVQPNLGALLEQLRVAARTVRVIVPPRPLGMAAYRLWRMRGWAGVGLLAHWVVVTGWQRAQVRVWFLGRGLRAVVRALTGAALLARQKGAWSLTIDHAVADFSTWGGETVTTAESILSAVSAWHAQRGT